MSRWSRVTGVVITILVSALIIAMWIESRRQQGTLSAQIDRLIRFGTTDSDTAAPRPECRDTVPAVVSRYLCLAIGTTQQIQEVRTGFQLRSGRQAK